LETNQNRLDCLSGYRVAALRIIVYRQIALSDWTRSGRLSGKSVAGRVGTDLEYFFPFHYFHKFDYVFPDLFVGALNLEANLPLLSVMNHTQRMSQPEFIK